MGDMVKIAEPNNPAAANLAATLGGHAESQWSEVAGRDRLDLARAMEPIIYFGIAVAISVAITAAVCRRRIEFDKKVSYGTMLIDALGAGLAAYVGSFFYVGGGEAFTLQFWKDPKQVPSLGGVLLGIAGTAVPCALAALGVVAYYQARQKNAKASV